ncbi:hypothetical protein M0804_011279 [Polistes exclamans]|nr:hypothetical protein M0804_011279 [Polistes exclamans]
MVVSPVGGRVPPNRGVLHNGLNLNGTRRDLEAEEVAAYLTKLRSLVPDMPRKRKLSKLEGVGVRKVRIDRVPILSGSRARSWEPWVRTIPTGTDPNQPTKQASKQASNYPCPLLAPPRHPLDPFEPTSHS